MVGSLSDCFDLDKIRYYYMASVPCDLACEFRDLKHCLDYVRSSPALSDTYVCDYLSWLFSVMCEVMAVRFAGMCPDEFGGSGCCMVGCNDCFHAI